MINSLILNMSLIIKFQSFRSIFLPFQTFYSHKGVEATSNLKNHSSMPYQIENLEECKEGSLFLQANQPSLTQKSTHAFLSFQ